jgi:hypothetical protein
MELAYEILTPHTRSDSEPVLAEDAANVLVTEIVSGEAVGDGSYGLGFNQ